MSITYKVTVKALPQGEEILMEMFEAKSDAEQYYSVLQNPQESILAGLPYACLSLALEEMYNGVWTAVSKKLVTK